MRAVSDNHSPERLSRRTCLTWAAAFGLTMSFGAAAATGAAHLTLRRNRLFVPAVINDVPVTALLDSAAEITLVDRQFAARIALGKGQTVSASGSGAGSVDAEIVEGVTLTAFGVSMLNAEVAIIDLSDVARRLNGARIDVILGGDIFDQARLEIDIDAGIIRTLDRDAPIAGTELTLTGDNGVETIAVTCEGKAARATFDLGNGSHVLVSPDFAAAMGFLSDGRRQWHETGGGLGGAADLTVFRLATLQVAGKTFRNVIANIDAGKNASDLNIGVELLRHFRIVTDFAQEKIWLA